MKRIPHLRAACLSLCFVRACSLPISTFGQGNTQLEAFVGGRIHIEGSLSANLSSWLVHPGRTLANDFAGFRPGLSGICVNPSTVRLQKNDVAFNWRPGISVSVEDLYDLQSTVRDEVDAQISDLKAPTLRLQDDDYPLVSADVGPAATFSVAIGIPFGPNTVALGFFRPLSARLGVNATGTQLKVRTASEDDATSDVTFLGLPQANVDLHAHVLAYAVSVSRSLTDALTAGFGFEQYSGSIELSARLDIDGLMITAGNERAFNDPNDPWPNDLYSRLDASYKGAASRLRFGLSYHPTDRFAAGVVITSPLRFRFTGEAAFIQYTIPGLNLQAEGDEDMLDPTKVSLDEPTRTRQVMNPVGKAIDLRLPASFGFGVGGRVLGIDLALSFSVPAGDISIEHELTKPNYTNTVKAVLQPGTRIGIGLGVWGIALDVGFRSVHAEFSDAENSSSADFPLPEMNLGYHFRLTRSLTGLVQFVSLPDKLGFVGLSYAF